jgi:transcription initiation factor IIE alpha subunit
MKTKIKLLTIGLVSLSIAFTACSSHEKKSTAEKNVSTTKITYVCPMDSEITSNKPGKCPKCGMDLVEKKSESSNDTVNKK